MTLFRGCLLLFLLVLAAGFAYAAWPGGPIAVAAVWVGLGIAIFSATRVDWPEELGVAVFVVGMFLMLAGVWLGALGSGIVIIPVGAMIAGVIFLVRWVARKR